jgi:hypothetical protein
MLYVDMERGLYKFPDGKQPRHRNGTYRVVKRQILKDCGITEEYGQAGAKIWNNPQFLALVEKERSRRDIGIADAVAELEQVTGPLTAMGEDIIKKVAEVFAREPDAEDPQALSPAQYVKLGREWFHEAMEVEGKVGAEKQKGIEAVMAQLYKGQQVTDTMLKGAMELVKEYRELQDRKLANVVDIDG